MLKNYPKTVKARAPLRLGLAGGGTDLSPYCDQFGGLVLSATITRYAYVIINTVDGDRTKFFAADQRIVKFISLDGPIELDGNLNLHVAVYRQMMNKYNDGVFVPLELITFCEAPVGSGLGSSSTLVVAMIKAFIEMLNLCLNDYEIAQLAFEIERIECQLEGGRQDQYSAVFGGFNLMEFYKNNRSVVNQLRIKSEIIAELESSLILFFTGLSRDSGKIINDQSLNVKNKKKEVVNAMHGIKQEALIMKECLLKGDFFGMVESMNSGWENKKLTAGSVSNPLIDEVYNQARKAGALAGKVSGAGGGGFMIFFVPAQFRMNVFQVLSEYKGDFSNCNFTKRGAQAWIVK